MILPGKAAFYEKCHSPNVAPPASCPVSTFGVFKHRQLLCGGEEMVAAEGGRHAHLRPLWALLGSPSEACCVYPALGADPERREEAGRRCTPTDSSLTGSSAGSGLDFFPFHVLI